jgi:ribosomal protein S24E
MMSTRIETNEQQVKKRIIDIMALVKKRLHINGIKVGTGKEELPVMFASTKSLTLVERIQQRGGDVSSNRFADIFTSRPNRMVSTSIEELVCTYETILELDMQILSANELLELCHLTRLPIAYISRFAKYFADDEWRTALQFYQLIPMNTPTDNICIGRDEVIRELTECLFAKRRKGQLWRQHGLVSGHQESAKAR